MTEQELYIEYLKWEKGKVKKVPEELFEISFAKYDVYEDPWITINYRFFLVPQFYQQQWNFFIFYEVNTFVKESSDGDLLLIYSTLKAWKPNCNSWMNDT